jgi:hypothetical protein
MPWWVAVLLLVLIIIGTFAAGLGRDPPDKR